MPKRPSPHPTGAELEILTVLWRRGASTVREVHEVLHPRHQTSLTTTLKTIQIMVDKGEVTCSDERPHRYAPTIPAEETQAGLLKDLVTRAFGGSVQTLLVRAVEAGEMTEKELDDLRKLVENLRRQGTPNAKHRVWGPRKRGAR